ncbi:MAG: NTP transferase domain-containing protein [Sandarakinorhabdus sp.]|nr:NTP transferase domain-containing protein [Sandarakinorhabdus sp.]
MRILGAVLAGGESTRFGSDKALALFAGKPLIDHAIAAIVRQVESLVIVGRDWPGFTRVDDLPAPGLGPLGGLCGALVHARTHGFDAVLCVPCDTLGPPADLAARLSPGPAVALGQRSIGLWPASLATALLARLASGDSRALHIWASACEARNVDCGALHNINHPEDLG